MEKVEQDEIWKDVEGYEGIYYVSNFGNVKGIVRTGSTGRNLKPVKNKFGYLTVRLYQHPNSKAFFIHRLVADAFIPNPDNKRTVNHIDGDKKNNNVTNLEWATHSENHKHAYQTGLKKVTEKQRKAASITGKKTCFSNRKKTPVVSTDIDGAEEYYISAHEAARNIGGDASAIIRCCKKKKDTYKERKWRYA